MQKELLDTKHASKSSIDFIKSHSESFSMGAALRSIRFSIRNDRNLKYKIN